MAFDDIAMPEPNPFVPTDLVLLEQENSTADEGSIPELFAEASGLRFWFKSDSEFRTPKADVFFSMLTRKPAESPRDEVLASLYVRAVVDALNEFIYPAQLAGMNFSFYRHLRGFSLKVSGYDDSVLPLLERVVPQLKAVAIEPARFDNIVAEYQRRLQVEKSATPFRRLMTVLGESLYPGQHNEDALLDALAAVTLDDLQQFVADLGDTVAVEALAHGNIDWGDASAIHRLLLQIPRCDCELEGRKHVDVRRLAAGTTQRIAEVDHADASINWYFQLADDSLRSEALVRLTVDIIHPLYFNDLRTERQLGYVVNAGFFPAHRWPGMLLLVQSPQASSEELVAITREFLDGVLQNGVEQEIFTRHRDALVVKLTERDQKLAERSQRYWGDLAVRATSFDRNAALAAELQQLEIDDWRAFVARLFDKNSASLLLTTAPGGGAGFAMWSDQIERVSYY